MPDILAEILKERENTSLVSRNDVQQLNTLSRSLGWEIQTNSPLSLATVEEQRQGTGLVVPPEAVRSAAAEIEEANRSANANPFHGSGVDWRPLTGQARNQNAPFTTNACVAFSTAAYLESCLRRLANLGKIDLKERDIHLSERFLHFCGRSIRVPGGGKRPINKDDGNGLRGGLIIAVKYPVPLNHCAPWGSDLRCSMKSSCPGWRNKPGTVKIRGGTGVIQRHNTLAEKKAILDKGPAIGGMELYQDFFAYKRGIYRKSASAWVGQHAMLFVGYEDTGNNQGYWIVKNSFGAAWGEGGYARIAYHQDALGIEKRYPFYTLPLGRLSMNPFP